MQKTVSDYFKKYFPLTNVEHAATLMGVDFVNFYMTATNGKKDQNFDAVFTGL